MPHNKFILVCVVLCGFSRLLGQGVIISATNGDVPDVSAMLHIKSGTKGILIPQTTSVSPPATPANGLLVYFTDKNQFFYNSGTPAAPLWVGLISAGAGSGFWSLTGNAGLNNATNFIGTTDAAPFQLRVNNVGSGYLDATGICFLGYQAGGAVGALGTTAVGFQALTSNTANGQYNTAVGYQSLFRNYAPTNDFSASYNTGLGALALYSNTTGKSNTAVGQDALFYNTTGASNTAVGVYALESNTTGANNTASGFQALDYNTTGAYNTATGYLAMMGNSNLQITGSYNTATGTHTLFSATSGSYNVAEGAYALNVAASASNNTAVGYQALTVNTADGNTAMGYNALSQNTSGLSNVGVGLNALSGNTQQNGNTAVGANAGAKNSGTSNTFLGLSADADIAANHYTGGVAVGANSVFGANYAIAIGASATVTNSGGASGAGAIAIGKSASVAADNSVALGTSATVNLGATNSVALGNGAIVSASNAILLGNSAITSLQCYAPSGLTNPSDRRLKTHIRDSKLGLSFIRLLKPVDYEYMLRGQEGIPQTGFIAQEVETAAIQSGAPDFIGVDKTNLASGGYYGLRYTALLTPMVKALQELDAQIRYENAQLKKELAEIKTTSEQTKQKLETIEIENQALKKAMENLDARLRQLEEKDGQKSGSNNISSLKKMRLTKNE